MRVKLYIENQRVDLFDDETISLNQSVKDLKDLSKVFNDFSNSFTVPATPNNNKIFKYYFDTDLVFTFDARRKQSARIDLDGFDFREGKIQLTAVEHKKGLPVNYKIQYFSNLTSLKDLFGDDKLGDIAYFQEYNHDYTDTNVANGFVAGLTLNGEQAAVVYPLISYDRRFVYNMTTPPENGVDISSGGDGVEWTELLPAIKCSSVLKSISENYGLTFSNEFFNTLEFQELYMSLISNDESVLGGAVNEIAFFEFAQFDSRVNYISRLRVELEVEAGFESVPYQLQVYKGDNLVVEMELMGSYLLSDIMSIVLPSPDTEVEEVSVRIFSQETLEFAETKIRFTHFIISLPDLIIIQLINDDRVDVSISDFILDIKLLMPDIKVIDWFNAIKQAFNLVIVPTGEKQFYVNDLNSWYTEGKIYDISQYVDTETKETKRGQLYKGVDMKFADNETFLAYNFKEINRRQFGSLQEDILIAGEKIDGDVLQVTLPFEKPIFERLNDINAGGITEVMYGFIADKSQENFNNKPFLFYAPLYVRPTGQLVKFNRTSTSTNFLGNRTPSSRRLIDQESFAVNFGSELNEFTGILNTESFYNTYWRDYINDTMSVKRREVNIKARLPQDLLFKLQPNDRLVVDGIRYIQNTHKTNLIKGDSSFSLLNDIFEAATPLDITGSFASPEEILVNHLPQQTEIVIYSREQIDTITSTSTWFSFDDSTFQIGVPFIITIDENNTAFSREDTIEFELETETITVEIIQLKENPFD